MNKVKVSANDEGLVVVTSKNNPEYGYIRVEQVRMVIDENGFAGSKAMSALIPGKIVDLHKFGWQADQEVEGKVYFKEQLKPFNPKQPDTDLKDAGDTGVICSVKGAPMYRKNFYSTSPTQDDLYIRDEDGNIISHDNTDAIKAVYNARKSEVKTNVEEEIDNG